MNTYLTGNPVPSVDVRDLYDNASNLDDLVNGSEFSYPDRKLQPRKSWAGMENDFSEFLANSGYVFIGDYDADGPLNITQPNQTFTKDGEYWRAGPSLVLPYTTVNNWVIDQPKFVSIGDAALRSDLADPAQGVYLVSRATGHFFSIDDMEGRVGRYDGDTANLVSFWFSQFLVGGPMFQGGAGIGGSPVTWMANMPKSSHDGGLIISPTVPAPVNLAALQNWYDGTGETDPSGNGCWVRNLPDGVVYVTYYGAVADNATDMTPAFNAATRGFEEYGNPLDPIDNDTLIKRIIGVPASGFAFRLEGTVYVRKGQHLRGLGDGPSRIFVPVVASSAPTFKLAFGKVGGVEVVDNGGLPPSISNLCTEGGHTTGAIVESTGVAGVSMYKMFITSAPRGFKGAGGDLVLNSCTFDDNTRAVEMTGSRNILSDCHFFHPSANAILIGSDSYDWMIRDCTFAFCEQQDIMIQGTDNTVRGISIVDCNFIENGQYVTKNAHIALNMNGAEVMIDACNFSNSRSWGIAELGVRQNFVRISNCHFTGRKSNDAYIQSSTARGIRIGGGRWLVESCDFTEMYDTPISITGNNTNDRIVVKDCTWVGNNYTGPLVTVTAQVGNGRFLLEGNVGDNIMPLIAHGNFSGVRLLNNSRWLGAALPASGRLYYKIPTFNSFVGTVRVTANPLPGGSILYRKSALFAVSRGVDNVSATVRDYVEQSSLHNPAVGLAGALSVQWDLDAVGSGAQLSPTAVGRSIVVSVPDTYQNFEVEVV